MHNETAGNSSKQPLPCSALTAESRYNNYSTCIIIYNVKEALSYFILKLFLVLAVVGDDALSAQMQFHRAFAKEGSNLILHWTVD